MFTLFNDDYYLHYITNYEIIQENVLRFSKITQNIGIIIQLLQEFYTYNYRYGKFFIYIVLIQ